MASWVEKGGLSQVIGNVRTVEKKIWGLLDFIVTCFLPFLREMPPAPAVFDEFVGEVCAVEQEHVSQRPPVLVLAVCLEIDFLRKVRSEAA